MSSTANDILRPLFSEVIESASIGSARIEGLITEITKASEKRQSPHGNRVLGVMKDSKLAAAEILRKVNALQAAFDLLMGPNSGYQYLKTSVDELRRDNFAKDHQLALLNVRFKCAQSDCERLKTTIDNQQLQLEMNQRESKREIDELKYQLVEAESQLLTWKQRELQMEEAAKKRENKNEERARRPVATVPPPAVAQLQFSEEEDEGEESEIEQQLSLAETRRVHGPTASLDFSDEQCEFPGEEQLLFNGDIPQSSPIHDHLSSVDSPQKQKKGIARRSIGRIIKSVRRRSLSRSRASALNSDETLPAFLQ